MKHLHLKPKFYLSIMDFIVLAPPIILIIFIFGIYLYNSSRVLASQGVLAFKKQDPQSAVRYFSKTLTQDSLNPYNHLNLALAYDFDKQPIKSEKIYRFVSSQFPNSQPGFFSYFNQGELYGRLGSIEKAINNYQMALEFKTKEEEIKKNIELLFKNNKNKKQKTKNKNNLDNKKTKDGDTKENKKQKTKDGDTKDENKNPDNKDGDTKKDEGKNQDKAVKDKQDQKQTGQIKNADFYQEQAVIKAIEKQEKEAREKAMKVKGEFGNKGGKDW